MMPSRLRSVCFVLLATVIVAAVARAQTTLLWAGANSTWATTTNWSPANIPDSSSETAAFDSGGNATAVIAANTTLHGITFNAGAKAFTFTVNASRTLTLATSGIANNSGSTTNLETFNVIGTLALSAGSASNAASGSSAIRLNLTPVAGTNNSHARLTFNGSATAGNAVISTTTAPNADRTNQASITFNSTASAGSASITLNTAGTGYGYSNLVFNGSASAASATITATATATNDGASAANYLTFNDSSTASDATFVLADSTGPGAASLLSFNGTATAGQAVISLGSTTNADFLGNASAGSATLTSTSDFSLISFQGSAKAGTASISTSGSLYFNDTASAESASITINETDDPSYGGILQFTGSAAAADATITLNGSVGVFGDSTTAGNASLIARNGARLLFMNTASGGTARVSLDDTSTLDLSYATVPVTFDTLAGSGTVAGLATITSGATLAPGNSSSPLTFTAGLMLEDGAILAFELGRAASSRIEVTGGTLTGSASAAGIVVNLTDAGDFAAGTYDLIRYAAATESDFTSFDFTDFHVGSGIAGYTYAFSFNGTTLQLTATAVPEPSTWAMLFGLSALACVILHRHSSHRKT